MPVYWSMLIFIGIVGIVEQMHLQTTMIGKEVIDHKTPYLYAIVIFAYIAFFCSFRDIVLDTSAYIDSFNALPMDWGEMIHQVSKIQTGKVFYLIAGIFKLLISDNHYAWLGFLCIISCWCILRGLYKNSVDFTLSAFLFIATTNFTWLINGTRQFLVVSILFACSNWLIEGKKWKYILLALLLTTIHSSAIFIIPVCFFISSKTFLDKKIVLFAVITVIGTKYSEKVFELLKVLMDKDYTDSLMAGGGSNIMRLLIASVPIIIVLMAYKYVKANAPATIRLAINMSFIGTCFYFASSFTNGILIGRMPIYFTVYNLYLLPWVIKNCFNEESKKIAQFACIVLYLVYFYYQMVVTWNGLTYVSHILNLNFP